MAVRLIMAGQVSPLRSQAIYHGVARAMGPGTPDTVILVSPTAPYVCIGFHQDVEREVNLDYCRKQGLPVVRREVGGGAVYLDGDQLFTQWVLHPGSMPMKVEERFKFHAYPIVKTYRALGIEAYFRPINDIQVAGKKIGGMGAGRIGQAEILVGNLMFDFNTRLMASVLNVPDEKFRDKVFHSLEAYMTTMKKELGELPDQETVVALYRKFCQEAFNQPLEEGELSQEEEEAIRAQEEKMASESWLFRPEGHARPAVKIHSGVWVGETTLKTPGGLLRITLRLKDNTIDDITLRGDFTFYPQDKLHQLEKTLLSTPVERDRLLERIGRFYREQQIQVPGVEPEHWVEAIENLAQAIARN
ncbi:MAG: lipoate--protein ligase family protein [Calditrichaeota bacterium]|nr:MAG: lipoate--protein ligase family protein [Calditrichota bacterium]